MPGSVMLDHCVDDRQELTHAGGNSDFLEFAGRKEALVESLDHGIESGRDDRWHVESSSDVRPPSPARPPAPHLAAITIERGYSN